MRLNNFRDDDDFSHHLEQRGDGFFIDMINRSAKTDDTARPVFPGERHMILKLPNGKNGIANWMGPGTQVVKRLERDDPGRTPSDTVAKMHDINYVLAQGEKTKEDQLKKIREADVRMINSMKNVKDAPRNVRAGLRLIQAKNFLEDKGVLSKSAFAGDLEEIPDKDRRLLESEKAKLEKKGYGIPGAKLKKKLINKIQRDNMVKNYSGYKMLGSGFSIKNLVMETIIPSLLKELNINANIPATDIERVLKLIKNPKQLTGSLATTILPRLIKAIKPNQSGKGIKELYEMLKKKGLADTLAAGIGKMLKWGVERQLKSRGVEPFWKKGNGLNLAGNGNFWQDFKKGFLSVFKPGIKVLGPVATALGAPELGIPLTALSEVL